MGTSNGWKRSEADLMIEMKARNLDVLCLHVTKKKERMCVKSHVKKNELVSPRIFVMRTKVAVKRMVLGKKRLD